MGLKRHLVRALIWLVHWFIKSKPNREFRAFTRKQCALVPAIRDAKALAVSLHPLLLRRSQANYCSETLTTDSLGFRKTVLGRRLVGLDDFLSSSGVRGIVSGNSLAFGMGASSDEATVASVLNRIDSNVRWQNLALFGAPTIYQERLSSDFFAPLNIEKYVTITGCIDVFLASCGRNGEGPCAPFFGESMFSELLRSHSSRPVPADREACLVEMLKRISREIGLLRRRWKDSRILFGLQPIHAWTNKIDSPEEQELLSLFYDIPGEIGLGYNPELIGPFHGMVREGLASACASADVDFMDLNKDPVLTGADWIFLDPVHLSDSGLSRIATRVAEWSMRV